MGTARAGPASARRRSGVHARGALGPPSSSVLRPAPGVSRGPEYCRERIEELRDLGYTVGVLGEDGKVVLAIVWTEDGPTTLAIGEQFNPGLHH